MHENTHEFICQFCKSKIALAKSIDIYINNDCLCDLNLILVKPDFRGNLKGQCHEVFDPRFFHQTIPPRGLIHGLKPFRI
jgi:hypothetical protein